MQRLRVERAVEPPPEVLERGDEVRARRDGREDAACQPGVEVVVRADDAGHREPALHRPDLGLRVPGREPGADGHDPRILDRDVDAALHRGRLELDRGDVVQDQHVVYSSTGPSR